LVGADGRAVTDLLPSGDVRIEGRVYDAVSNGVAINRGQAVRVVDVNTQRLVVRPLSEREVAERNQVNDVLATPLDELGIESLDDPLA
jgi:membrane-bound ClpP family serine protease